MRNDALRASDARAQARVWGEHEHGHDRETRNGYSGACLLY
jgi:hypothetical protein